MQKFNLIYSIKDCTLSSYDIFDKIIKKGYIIYSHGNNTFVIDAQTLKEILNTKIEWSAIIEMENEFYYVFNRSLYKINFTNLCNEKLFSTDEEALSIYTPNIVSFGSSNWRTDTQNFRLIRLPDQELIKWDDKRELFGVFNHIAIFRDFETKELYAVDLNNKYELWRIPFDNGIPGRRYVQELPNFECIFQRYFELNDNNLLKLNLKTGHIVWEIDKSFNYYNYDEKSGRLFGLGYWPKEYICSKFEIINVETGEREMQKELDLQVPAHLTFYADGYLYFSGYKGDNLTRIFGAADVNTGEIAFTQSIEMPNGETYRGSYDRPVVVGNRLYIRDQSKTLHIYERQAQPRSA